MFVRNSFIVYVENVCVCAMIVVVFEEYFISLHDGHRNTG